MEGFKPGDCVEALDADGVWTEAKISRIISAKEAEVVFVGSKTSVTTLQLAHLGTNTRRRKCVLLDARTERKTPGLVYLSSASSASAEKALRLRTRIPVLLLPTMTVVRCPVSSLQPSSAHKPLIALWRKEFSQCDFVEENVTLEFVEGCLAVGMERFVGGEPEKLPPTPRAAAVAAAPVAAKVSTALAPVEPRRRSGSNANSSSGARSKKRTAAAKSASPHAALAARYRRFEERLAEEEDEAEEDVEEASEASAERKLRMLQHRVELFCEDEEEDDALEEEAVYITKQPKCIVGGEMRAYQIEGLQWLVSQWNRGIPMILADEMGLGKTLQAIALLGYLRLERPDATKKTLRPSLVVVPLAVLANWSREFEKWCPALSVYVVRGEDARANMLKQDGVDVYLTTFDILRLEKSRFKRLGPWNFIILDEAHRVKNDESQLSKTCREMDSQFRLLLTGTPLQNNFHELWSLLNFLIPKLFSDADLFALQAVSVEELKTTRLRELLRSILQPFLLRRLKADTTREIPPKREIKLFCGMSEMQAYWYRQILSKNAETLTELSASCRGLQNICMQLRKVCNHPYLFEGAEPGPPFVEGAHMVTNCGKMVLLDKLLVRLSQAGDRVLIFSQMTQMLDILEDYLQWRKYPFCRLDGSTPITERYELIDEFNREGSDKFCFLLSTRAGGLGINLQTANVVILYDSDWNPFVDLQAQDRAHRLGQTREVSVFRFITENTIEEKIVERAEHKLFLDAVVVQQHAAKLSKDVLASAIGFGAEAVFRTTSSTITDEDIDTILARGEALSGKNVMRDGVQLTLGSFQAVDTKLALREQKEALRKALAPALQAKTEVLGKRRSRTLRSFSHVNFEDDDDEEEDEEEEAMSSEEEEDVAAATTTSSSKPRGKRAKPTPPPSTSSSLPAGWKEGVVSKTGRKYYFNVITREATYDFPAEEAKSAGTTTLAVAGEDATAAPLLPPGWKAAVEQPSGRMYYFNLDTMESTWKRPVVEDGSTRTPPPLVVEEVAPTVAWQPPPEQQQQQQAWYNQQTDSATTANYHQQLALFQQQQALIQQQQKALIQQQIQQKQQALMQQQQQQQALLQQQQTPGYYPQSTFYHQPAYYAPQQQQQHANIPQQQQQQWYDVPQQQQAPVYYYLSSQQPQQATPPPLTTTITDLDLPNEDNTAPPASNPL